MAVHEPTAPASSLARRPQSPWRATARRLALNRAAVAGLAIIAALLLVYIFADLIAVRPYDVQVLADRNAVPAWLLRIFPTMAGYARVSKAYPLGADPLGRDLFSRIVYGTRVSLTVAIVGPLFSLLVGLLYGSTSGYFGGRVDELMMRFLDLMYAFPTLLLIILIMAFFRAGFAGRAEPGTFKYAINQLDRATGGMLFILVGISITSWVGTARLARGQVLSLRRREFIEAARAVGAGHRHILFRHLLPSIVGPLIVAEALAVPGYILAETFLSFIGLGINPPTPSWGALIADGTARIRAYPHHALFPSLALAITMLGFNLLGDGLRDALDPHTRDRA